MPVFEGSCLKYRFLGSPGLLSLDLRGLDPGLFLETSDDLLCVASFGNGDLVELRYLQMSSERTHTKSCPSPSLASLTAPGVENSGSEPWSSDLEASAAHPFEGWRGFLSQAVTVLLFVFGALLSCVRIASVSSAFHLAVF